jgi:hypothetical protein
VRFVLRCLPCPLADACQIDCGHGAGMNAATNIERKWQRILRAFADGQHLTRFDAEKIGDHSLNTTVAQLADRGIVLSRVPIILDGRFGRIPKPMRYGRRSSRR